MNEMRHGGRQLRLHTLLFDWSGTISPSDEKLQGQCCRCSKKSCKLEVKILRDLRVTYSKVIGKDQSGREEDCLVP